METAAGGQGAFGEVVVFLSHFKALEKHARAGKVSYPFDEILLLCLPARGAGRGENLDIARLGSTRCAASGPLFMARRRTITSAIFSRCSMPRRSSAASWRGSRR
jgi:hypothetical protein